MGLGGDSVDRGTQKSLARRVTDALDAAGEATGAELLALMRARHAGDPELLREIEALLGESMGGARAARVAAARYLCRCWMRRLIRTPRRRWCGRRLRDLGFRGRDPARTAPRKSPSRCRKRSVGIGCYASLGGAGWGWCTSVSRLSPSGKSR